MLTFIIIVLIIALLARISWVWLLVVGKLAWFIICALASLVAFFILGPIVLAVVVPLFLIMLIFLIFI